MSMTAGALKKKEGATIEFEPLIQSSTNSALLPTRASSRFCPTARRCWMDSKRQVSGTRSRRAFTASCKSAFPERRTRRCDAGERLKEAKQRCEPDHRRRHRHPRGSAVDSQPERVRSAPRDGLGEQRRLPRQRARQPGRQRGSDQHPRAAELLPSVHQGR